MHTAGFQLIWEDTFEAGKLNTGAWHLEVNGNGGGNNELQYYRAENVSVGTEPASGAGCMIITARKETFGGKQFTSGRVNTYQTKTFRHGILEARIRMPRTANGLWPAFWIMGDNIKEGWPQCGEIDIAELGSRAGINQGQQDRFLTAAGHWGELSPNGSHDNYGLHNPMPYDIQDDFHLYTLIWDNDYLRMYLDIDRSANPTPYYEMLIRKEAGQAANHPANYLHRPMHILLNIAVGGGFPEIFNAAGITALNAGNNYEAKMYVDYIRLYQKGSPEANESFTDGTEPLSPEVQQYSLVPNPATDEVTIAGPHAPQSVSIYDYNGRRLAVYAQTNRINISGLSPGNYILSIEAPGRAAESLKLVKK
ncbi:MAG: family 16 glycosylhydrolase [Tannerellaceae bacterium]|jgi:beta-glucanase (GH16 family)|nr:family 16 glycosylhydrolase [Tannerellaceae bacterium]